MRRTSAANNYENTWHDAEVLIEGGFVEQRIDAGKG